ncbi:sulfatase-like hydrolase/transferase [Catenovulum sp. SM1970]|uniref:phosphoethanolamine transferase n=1 Tax=Marinifaba aquimaris TaxID=2741323 RepID=UPI0015748C87|nr:phosphoethanolamine transferase [Marinifaba aquimaris]NTS76254.1 sulfatase-like hydrolase/transferase [Marinifaba aquimaris]
MQHLLIKKALIYISILFFCILLLTINQGRSLGGVFLNTTYSLSILIAFFALNKSIFKLPIYLTLSLIYGFNLYYSINYGSMDVGVIASIVETNRTEALEFFQSTSKLLITFTIVLIIIFIVVITKADQLIANLSFGSKLCFTLPFVLLTIILYSHHSIKNGFQLLKKNIFTNPFISIQDYRHYKKIENEQLKHVKSDWLDVSNQGIQKDIYVVVIGESARRDKFRFYGYNRNTTQDIKELNNYTVVKQAIAPSVITRVSIPRVLAINNYKDVNFNLNIVDLSKAAGFSTFWLSNQESIGKHASAVNIIAKRADSYTNVNQSNSIQKSDFELLDTFKEIIHNRESKPKVIFIHTIGSHPDFCSRVTFGKNKLKKSNQVEELECYDNSILQTFELISTIQSILKTELLSHSIVYFSDHGLVTAQTKPYLKHGVGKLFSEKAVDVPFFFITDTQDSYRVIDKTYFLRDFPHTFAQWVKIDAKQIDRSKSILNHDHSKLKQAPYTLDSKLGIREL